MQELLCKCSVEAYGNSVAKLATLAVNKDCPFSFQNITPVSRRARAMDSEGLVVWKKKNWGTYAEPENVEAKITAKKAEYRFTTIWGPPIPIVRKLFRLFPELRFWVQFEQRGGWTVIEYFQGHCTIQNGTLNEPYSGSI